MHQRSVYIILASLILLGLTYWLVTQTEWLHATNKIQDVHIDTSIVDQLVLKKNQANADSIVLKKTNTKWTVNYNNTSYPIPASIINRALEALNAIYPERVLSRLKDDWNKYNVDTSGVYVQVYNKNKVTEKLVIGKLNIQNQSNINTYFRYADFPDTYQTPGLACVHLNPNPSFWRDNTVLNLGYDTITAIKITSQQKEIYLFKKTDGWYQQKNKLSSEAINTYLNSVKYCTSFNFYNTPLSTQQPTLQLEFISTHNTYSVKVFEVSGEWLIQSSQNKQSVFKDATLKERIFKLLTILEI